MMDSAFSSEFSNPSGIEMWLDVLCFSLALWLGTYLLKRNSRNMAVCLPGLGLLLYACAEGCFVLSSADSLFSTLLAEIGQWLLVGSALLWIAGLVFSLPQDRRFLGRPVRGWLFALLLTTILACTASLLLKSFLPLIFGFFLLLLLVGLTWYMTPSHQTLLSVVSLVLLVTIGIALMVFPQSLVRLLVCCALLMGGIVLAARDAADQGEAWLPDLFRAFDYALLTALVFGGQMALVMLFATGVTFPALLLLLSTLTTAIIIQVFSRTFVKLLDGMAFATFPQLKQARAELHTAIEVLPRLQPEMDLDALDEAEFTRLTRRALSHLGDLPRLASNPLTHLPVIQARLHARGVRGEDVLEAAEELKMVLTESICRLKPRGKGDFGTSDEWRYYNALYFPYIRGIKPYSRRFHHSRSDPAADEALDWFRTQVPQRTLHNWQNTAAKLVAQDLRSRQSLSTPKIPPANAIF